jgi:hypothetical protein
MSKQATRFLSGAALLFTTATAAAYQSQYPFTPDVDFDKTLFITPVASPNLSGPMLLDFLSTQKDPAKLGGGDFVKVGIAGDLGYSVYTEGCADDFKYYINRGPPWAVLPLPPGVTKAMLPSTVLYGLTSMTSDDLPITRNESQMPTMIAAFEWARYYNLPLTVELHSSGPQAGLNNFGSSGFTDLDRWFEMGGPLDPNSCSNPPVCVLSSQARRKNQHQWDVSDICGPNPPDDPCTFQQGDPSLGVFASSFATPTMADPTIALTVFPEQLEYRKYLFRNLHDAIVQLLAVASEQRYAGLLAGVAIDPEIHYPAYVTSTAPTPAFGSGTTAINPRPFMLDYNPAIIRQFAYYERDRYGDTTPFDTNGDGHSFQLDFGANYLASGDGTHSHASVPASWDLLDAPRVIPHDDNADGNPLWNEWTNFHSHVLDQFIEEMVATIADAGVPPERIFTHQTGGATSYHAHRYTGHVQPGQPAAGAVIQWLDEFHQMEVEKGSAGTSIYQPGGVLDSIPDGFTDSRTLLYDQLAQRTDSWGSPEFNPYIIDPSPFLASTARLTAVLQKAFSSGAHVLWPFAWGHPNYPVIDVASHRHALTLLPSGAYEFRDVSTGATSLAWTLTNCSFIPNVPTTLAATCSHDQYIESPPMNVPAASFSKIAFDMYTHYGGTPVGCTPGTPPQPYQEVDLKIEFQRGGTWYPHVCKVRTDTAATIWFAVDMASDPNWTGTITGLRFHPFPANTYFTVLNTIYIAGQNQFTSLMQSLTQGIDANGRKQPPQPLALGLGTDLAGLIQLGIVPFGGTSTASDQSHIKVYGTDPISHSGGPLTWDDFDTTGNFEPMSNPQCGGVTLEAGIRETPATHLGMRKTGRFRRIQLPDLDDVYLSFKIGLEDMHTYPPFEDGVRFRVMLRDANGVLVTAPGSAQGTLFDKEWRQHAWSPTYFINLTPYRNQVVDLYFETHSIADTAGDKSIWGNPMIARLSHDFGSIAAEDGFVRGTPGGAGVAADSVTVGFRGLRIGDSAANEQIKTVASFDTSSIPVGATILGGRLKLYCGATPLIGGPVPALPGTRALQIELKSGGFVTPPATPPESLVASDFEANSSVTMGPIAVSTATFPANSWVTFELDAATLAFVNASPHFQVRVSFVTGTDGNGAADYVGFFSADGSSPYAAVLEIAYQ